MKKEYIVTVNGKSYEVTVSEKDGQHPVVEEIVPANAKSEPKVETTGTPVTAPMGGMVKDIVVKVGDTIEDGAVVAIVEVMKMDTEVTAESSGKVESIQVNKGDNLESGAVICTIK
ncbi:MAG: acetyl-CoA carboxylase biotin carboxyl carrier protein subunit [Firmicutes bacterium]|nr:acetyl-CoA carboxylase biotin carboxyl carrier protein subunit [Bacillota bacterium]MDD4263142.1 acetyl-CoA carboxylase biotin carboxyl carrier protein subunit [Bacillota bacterium]MDD4694330.1 acetyl-CoA carboxylase biotin carboxyl carrier protein subunit [Bacillota bacterium]